MTAALLDLGARLDGPTPAGPTPAGASRPDSGAAFGEAFGRAMDAVGERDGERPRAEHPPADRESARDAARESDSAADAGLSAHPAPHRFHHLAQSGATHSATPHPVTARPAIPRPGAAATNPAIRHSDTAQAIDPDRTRAARSEHGAHPGRGITQSAAHTSRAEIPRAKAASSIQLPADPATKYDATSVAARPVQSGGALPHPAIPAPRAGGADPAAERPARRIAAPATPPAAAPAANPTPARAGETARPPADPRPLAQQTEPLRSAEPSRAGTSYLAVGTAAGEPAAHRGRKPADPAAPAVAPLSSAIPATAAATPATASAPPAAAAAVPLLQPDVANILAQLRGSPDGTHQLRAQVHPAELGAVAITATVSGGTLTVLLSADHQAHAALSSALPQLRAHLADQGFTGVDVGLGSPDQPASQAGGQSGERHTQGSDHTRESGERAVTDEPPAERRTMTPTGAIDRLL